MTAKREAELETENRMLRGQVASLEKIIEGMQHPEYQVTVPVPGCAPYPWYGTWYYPVTTWSGGDGIVTGAISPQESTTELSWPWRGSPPRQVVRACPPLHALPGPPGASPNNLPGGPSLSPEDVRLRRRHP